LEDLHKDYNIENQDNKSDYTTTGAILPGVAMASCGEGFLGGSKREEGGLNEEADEGIERQHVDWCKALRGKE